MARYPPEWPFGRVDIPGGGKYITEYGRSIPLPETLTELRMAGLAEDYVGSTITAVRAPPSIKSDEQFIIEVDIMTSGTGADKQFLALFDSSVGDYLGAGISDEPIPPDQAATWTVTLNPLDNWYPGWSGTSIPETLQWIARVGYVTEELPDGGFNGIITDERNIVISVATVGVPWWQKYKYALIGVSGAAAVGIVAVAARR